MLEHSDLQAIRDIMKEEIGRSENLLKDIIKTEIGRSENLVLNEVDRVQENLETKMEQLKRNMDELTQYYRTVKLDHENNALFLQMIQEIKKEVNELKMKIAYRFQMKILHSLQKQVKEEAVKKS